MGDLLAEEIPLGEHLGRRDRHRWQETQRLSGWDGDQDAGRIYLEMAGPTKGLWRWAGAYPKGSKGRPIHRDEAANIVKNRMTFGGTFDEQKSPKRSLTCQKLAKGFHCERIIEGVRVTILTNGNRSIEKVVGLANGSEIAGVAYVCKGKL